jgi:hypothetical protein
MPGLRPAPPLHRRPRALTAPARRAPQPIPFSPRSGRYKRELVERDGARIDEAFRALFHRAAPDQARPRPPSRTRPTHGRTRGTRRRTLTPWTARLMYLLNVFSGPARSM